jgi:glycosidase
MKRILTAALASLLLLSGCAPQPAPQAQPIVETVIDYGLQDAVIYEVNIRQFTPEGTFKAFQEHLPRIKELGVEVLWLMPLHPISELNKKGSLGSPYSVADYYGVNPEFGTEQDFRELVAAVHELDMIVILDWVANHTGWDNPWIYSNPDWYTQDESGNIVHPPGTDWTDVADLNFTNWDMRMAMIDAMKYWVTEYDVDGFRADVAHSVPVDFWNLASEKLHEVKDVFMLAEDGGDMALLKTAFDTNYAWPLKDHFNRLGKNLADAGDFRRNLKSTATQYKDGKYQMVFIDNHDENTWHGTVFERLGDNVANLAVISFTVPGMPLIYGGNEIGLDRRLEFFERDPIIWPEPFTNEWELFYKRLVELRTQNPALFSAGGGGPLNFLHLDNSDVIAFARSVPANEFREANDVIVIANIAPESQIQSLEFGDLAGDYVDWFSAEEMPLQAAQAIEVPANSFRVLVRSNHSAD